MRLAEAISTTWFGAYWLHTGHSPLQTGLWWVRVLRS